MGLPPDGVGKRGQLGSVVGFWIGYIIHSAGGRSNMLHGGPQGAGGDQWSTVGAAVRSKLRDRGIFSLFLRQG